MGQLCSLRLPITHKYCQILFNSRPLWETGLSRPLLDMPAVCRGSETTFFPLWGCLLDPISLEFRQGRLSQASAFTREHPTKTLLHPGVTLAFLSSSPSSWPTPHPCSHLYLTHSVSPASTAFSPLLAEPTGPQTPLAVGRGCCPFCALASALRQEARGLHSQGDSSRKAHQAAAAVIGQIASLGGRGLHSEWHQDVPRHPGSCFG